MCQMSFFTWYLISIGNDIPIGGIDDIPVIKRIVGMVMTLDYPYCVLQTEK